MQNDEIRYAVRAVIGSVAPGADLGALRPDRPLREQIDLDSMDWLDAPATSLPGNMADNMGAAIGALPDEAMRKRMITLVEGFPAA